MTFTTFEKLALNSDNWNYYYHSEIKTLENLYNDYCKKVEKEKIFNKNKYISWENYSDYEKLYEGTGEILYQIKKSF